MENPECAPTEKGFQLGIIGAGEFAQLILPVLEREIVCPRAVYDLSKAASLKLQGLCPDLEIVESLEDMLADDRIEGIYIATPPHTHAELVKKCAGYGKPVLCEKPLTLTEEEANDLVQCLRTRPDAVQIGVCSSRLLFSPQSKLAIEQVQAGALGEIFAVHLISSISRPEPVSGKAGWKQDPEMAGGGLIGSWCIYELEWLRQVLGPLFQPETLSCQLDYWNAEAAPVDTGYVINISSTRGPRVLITRTAHIGPARSIAKVHGKQGTLILSLIPSDDDQTVVQFQESDGNLREKVLGDQTGNWTSILSGPIVDFVEGVQQGRPVLTPMESQPILQRILDACRESGYSKSKSVKIKEQQSSDIEVCSRTSESV